MVFESRVAALDAYCLGPASEQFTELLSHFVEHDLLNAKNAKLAYQGDAPFDHTLREVTLWRSARRAQIDIDGEPVCQVDFDEAHVHVLSTESFSSQVNLEATIGPALVLLLAEADVFCLHAGCVATPAGNIGIIAESGSGKSTLSKDAGAIWQQLADDILPMSFTGGKGSCPILLPDYPQLKLAQAQVKVRPNADLALDYLLRLNPEPADEVEFVELNRKDAMLQIVRHTVAAKLFDRNIMKQHADFAKQVSKQVPVLQISYPRKKKQLPELRMKVVEAFARIRSRVAVHE